MIKSIIILTAGQPLTTGSARICGPSQPLSWHCTCLAACTAARPFLRQDRKVPLLAHCLPLTGFLRCGSELRGVEKVAGSCSPAEVCLGGATIPLAQCLCSSCLWSSEQYTPWRQERAVSSGSLSEEQLKEEERVRDQWIAGVPHQPEEDLKQAILQAAFPSSSSSGLVILTSGKLQVAFYSVSWRLQASRLACLAGVSLGQSKSVQLPDSGQVAAAQHDCTHTGRKQIRLHPFAASLAGQPETHSQWRPHPLRSGGSLGRVQPGLLPADPCAAPAPAPLRCCVLARA